MLTLTPYNLPKHKGRILSFSREISAEFDAVVGLRQFKAFQRRAASIVRVRAELHILLPRKVRIANKIACISEMSSTVLRPLKRAVCNVLADITAAKDMNTARTYEARFDAGLEAGKRMGFERGINAETLGVSILSKLMYLRRKLHGFINARILAKNLAVYADSAINVEIPPGGALILDSEAFTALLGEENALCGYNGDWLNLFRETVCVKLEAGTGGELEARLVFQERFI
jgi:hypothetical protein